MTDYTSPVSDQELGVRSDAASSPVREHDRSYGPGRRAGARSPAKTESIADSLIYWLCSALIAVIQSLPLRFVARLGRAAGALAFYLDARHRRTVLNNLASVFGREKPAAEIQAIAHENFKRIGENNFCAIKTAAMSFEELRPHLEFTGLENFPQSRPEGKMRNAVVALGHFGNFELHARVVEALPHDQVATTFRAFKQPSLNRLMQSLRAKSGCVFFERRADGAALRARLNRGGLILGLLADQSSAGMRAPFLGIECNVGLAPAILALRYQAVLSTAICYRTGLAKWRVECGKPIPTQVDGHPRSSQELMLDVNRELEAAVRRDPANWFWVHRRWKK